MRDGGFTSTAYPVFADSRYIYRRYAGLSSLIRGYFLTDSRYLATPVLSQPRRQGRPARSNSSCGRGLRAVRFTQVGDERVDLDCAVVTGGGETTHSLQSPGDDLVVVQRRPFHDDPPSVNSNVDVITRRQPKRRAYVGGDDEPALLTEPKRDTHA